MSTREITPELEPELTVQHPQPNTLTALEHVMEHSVNKDRIGVGDPKLVVDVDPDRVHVGVARVGPERVGLQMAQGRVPVEFEPASRDRAHGSHDLTEAAREVGFRTGCAPGVPAAVELMAESQDAVAEPLLDQVAGETGPVRVVRAGAAVPERDAAAMAAVQ